MHFLNQFSIFLIKKNMEERTGNDLQDLKFTTSSYWISFHIDFFFCQLNQLLWLYDGLLYAIILWNTFVSCPVVDINATDADHGPQVHPPRSCTSSVLWYHTLTTQCTAVCKTSVHCITPSPSYSCVSPRLILPKRLLKC